MPTVPNSNPYSGFLPMGVDRADGLGGRVGTATPLPNLQIADSQLGDIVGTNEDPESPTIERGEQCTCVKKYNMSYDQCMAQQKILPRGATVYDSGGNFWKVLTSNSQHRTGDYGTLTVTLESLNFDVPPDEFQINSIDLGLDLLKNPRYYYALMPSSSYGSDLDTPYQETVKSAVVRALQAYRENPYYPTATTINSIVGTLHDNIHVSLNSRKLVFVVPWPSFNASLPATAPIQPGVALPASSPVNPGDPNPQYYYVSFDSALDDDPGDSIAMCIAAACECIGKIWRQEDTPLVSGVEITLSEYSYVAPYMNLGSYIESPLTGPQAIPDYFYSSIGPIPDPTQTIFDNIANYNPQDYSATGQLGGQLSISWLRLADTIEYARTWFKITRKWRGAPLGAWDIDIYSGGQRPTLPSQYRPLQLSGP